MYQKRNRNHKETYSKCNYVYSTRFVHVAFSRNAQKFLHLKWDKYMYIQVLERESEDIECKKCKQHEQI